MSCEFDADAVAQRVEKIVSLEHESDPQARFEALRQREDQFYVEGRDKGVKFAAGSDCDCPP